MIITIGRQHGSNGHLIAQKLSEYLSIPCYDKEIIDEAVANSGFCKEIYDTYDEKKVSPFSLAAPHYANFGSGMNLNMQVATSQFEAIKALAEKGDCIFVGRCADYTLRARPDLVKVFIHADYAYRVRTIMERKSLTPEQAKKLIKEVDRDRSSYYRYYTDQNWGDPDNYEISIDSGRVGVEGAALTVQTYIKNIVQENNVY